MLTANESTCVNRVVRELDQGLRECTCNVECEETEYKVMLSQSIWPAQYQEVRTQIFSVLRLFRNITVDIFVRMRRLKSTDSQSKMRTATMLIPRTEMNPTSRAT